MNLFKLLAAGAAAGIIITTFRDQNGGWIVPGGPLFDRAGGELDEDDGDAEPILGYDGMDEETLQDWLNESGSDRSSLLRMIRYEAAHRGRQPVLATLVDQL